MNISFYDCDTFFKGRGGVRGEIFGEKRAGEKKCGFQWQEHIMSDILGMLQEVDLLTDGVSLSSLNRAAALKLGDEFEKYVKEKSQEMIESAKVVTKYGNPPLPQKAS